MRGAFAELNYRQKLNAQLESQEALQNILRYQMVEELRSLRNGHQDLDFHLSQWLPLHQE